MPEIEFDQVKRDLTLKERGLDFAEAERVFSSVIATMKDERYNYGEPRLITIGRLENRTVVLVWTPRGNFRRIISMRYANEREISKYTQPMG